MENAVSSEEIFKKADEYYKSLSKDRLESLTRKGFQQELIEKYGEHFVISKDDFAKLISNNADQDMEVDEESDGDKKRLPKKRNIEDDPRFMELSDEWRAMYGNIVWSKTHKNYPWWPSFVYDPEHVARKLRIPLLNNSLGKKHLVYCYGAGNFDYATLAQIAPFEDHPEYQTQAIKQKGYVNDFQKGIELAMEDLKLPKNSRVQWNHPKEAEVVEETEQEEREEKKKLFSTPKAKSNGTSTPKSQAKPKSVSKKVTAKPDPAPPPSDTKEEAKPKSEEKDDAAMDEEEEVEGVEQEDEEEDDDEGQWDEEEEEEFDEKPKAKKMKSESKPKAPSSSSAPATGDASGKEAKEKSKSSTGAGAGAGDSKKRKAEGSDKVNKESSKKAKEDSTASENKKKSKKLPESNNNNNNNKSTSAEKMKSALSAALSSTNGSSSAKSVKAKVKGDEKKDSKPQHKDQKAGDASKGVSSKSGDVKSAPKAAAVLEETRVQRATRLIKLIEEKMRVEPINVDKVKQTLDKLKEMNLDIKELKECKLVDSLNVIRKHSNVAMATHAKNLRSFLKEQALQAEVTSSSSAGSAVAKENELEKIESGKADQPDVATATEANESVGVIKEEELTSAVAAVDAPSEGGGGEVSLDMLETVKDEKNDGEISVTSNDISENQLNCDVTSSTTTLDPALIS